MSSFYVTPGIIWCDVDSEMRVIFLRLTAVLRHVVTGDKLGGQGNLLKL